MNWTAYPGCIQPLVQSQLGQSPASPQWTGSRETDGWVFLTQTGQISKHWWSGAIPSIGWYADLCNPKHFFFTYIFFSLNISETPLKVSRVDFTKLTINKVLAFLFELGGLLGHIWIENSQLVEFIEMKSSICKWIFSHDQESEPAWADSHATSDSSCFPPVLRRTKGKQNKQNNVHRFGHV